MSFLELGILKVFGRKVVEHSPSVGELASKTFAHSVFFPISNSSDMSVNEIVFAQKYLDLINITSPKVLFDNHSVPITSVKSPGDLSFRKLRVKSVPPPRGEVQIQVNLRSIKPPKFSVDYSLSGKTTIYTLKQKLVENGYVNDNSTIKLMNKSKIAGDEVSLEDLAKENKLSLVVMVSKEATSNVQEDTEPPSELPSKTITSQSWSKIHQLLRDDLGEPEASKVLDRWKTSSS